MAHACFNEFNLYNWDDNTNNVTMLCNALTTDKEVGVRCAHGPWALD